MRACQRSEIVAKTAVASQRLKYANYLFNFQKALRIRKRFLFENPFDVL